MKLLSVVIRPDGGGAERTVAMLQPELRALGVEAITASLDAPRIGEFVADGLVLTESKARVLRVWLAARRLSQLVKALQPDIIHLHCEAPELAFALAVARPSGPRSNVVITEHSQNAWRGKRRLLRFAVRGLVRMASHSYDVVDCFHGGEHDSYIPNPVSRPMLAGRGASPRLVVIGRLIPTKRVDIALRAAGAANWQGRVEVIGDGPERRNLERVAHSAGVDANFHGFSATPWELVNATDVVVTASELEGDPLSILEAASVGLPILASDIPPHLAILGAEHLGLFRTESELTALLVQLNDGESFVPSMEKSARLEERAPREIARRWVSHYSSLLG